MKPLKTHCIPFLLTACLAQVGTVFAAPITWNGTTNTDFATGTNWNSGIAPANNLTGDIATFSGPLTANQPFINASYSVNGIDFTSSGWNLGGAPSPPSPAAAIALSFGSAGITNIGNNTISANISANNPGAHTVSSAAGSTLTINEFTGSNGSNVIFGTTANTGTVSLQGSTDNNFLSGTIAYGTVILNKGTVGGTANGGSTFNNVTINSGATVIYGANSTDRNPTATGSQGQIYGTATINGTLDLNGNGTFSDNWGVGSISGTTGVITNNGSGAAQLRILGGNNTFSGTIKDGTSTTSLQINAGNSNININGAANTYTGGTEIISGQGRFNSDASLGAVPATPTVNITINGATARLMNNAAVVVNANRTILIGAAGGGFQAGFNSNLTINSAVIGTGAVKIYGDNGTIVFAGINTYSGNTVMDANNSKFTLADDGSMLFQIGANGVNNQITGSAGGTGTVTLDGDFNFNLALASLVNGNVWTIVNAPNVNETYGATFNVVGFTEAADVWTKIDGGNTWTFRESNGQLSLIPEPSSLALLSALGVFGLVRRNRR